MGYATIHREKHTIFPMCSPFFTKSLDLEIEEKTAAKFSTVMFVIYVAVLP